MTHDTRFFMTKDRKPAEGDYYEWIVYDASYGKPRSYVMAAQLLDGIWEQWFLRYV